ncbi:hypothetical protein KKH43_06435 [Patescibacteria group bacterium]|nr:hypothetical protein [Patescibacteria group bacterium]
MRIVLEQMRIEVEIDNTHVVAPFAYLKPPIPLQASSQVKKQSRNKKFKIAGLITLLFSLLGLSSGGTYYFAIKSIKKLVHVQTQQKRKFEIVIFEERKLKPKKFKVLVIPPPVFIEEIPQASPLLKASFDAKKKRFKIVFGKKRFSFKMPRNRRKVLRRHRKKNHKRVKCACK